MEGDRIVLLSGRFTRQGAQLSTRWRPTPVAPILWVRETAAASGRQRGGEARKDAVAFMHTSTIYRIGLLGLKGAQPGSGPKGG